MPGKEIEWSWGWKARARLVLGRHKRGAQGCAPTFMPWLPCSSHSSRGPRMKAEPLGPLPRPEAAPTSEGLKATLKRLSLQGTRVGGGEAGLP